MALRFSKRIKIAPGIKLNIGKRGVSATVGPKGASINFGQNGTHLNSSLPGTGISMRQRIAGGTGNSSRTEDEISKGGSIVAILFGVAVLIVLAYLIF